MLLQFKGPSVLPGAIGGGLISLASCLYFFQVGRITVAQIALVPSVFFLLSAALIFIANRRNAELNAFLIANRQEITRGEIHFRGRRITVDTRVIRFKVVLSFFVVTYSFDSVPFLYGASKPWIASIGYSLLSLVIGLWSFSGIYSAPLSALDNLRFKQERSVGDSYEVLDAGTALGPFAARQRG